MLTDAQQAQISSPFSGPFEKLPRNDNDKVKHSHVTKQPATHSNISKQSGAFFKSLIRFVSEKIARSRN